jgi:hypothetical protein
MIAKIDRNLSFQLKYVAKTSSVVPPTKNALVESRENIEIIVYTQGDPRRDQY